MKNKLIVLGYHNVASSDQKSLIPSVLYNRLSVQKENFELQLLWLLKNKFVFLHGTDIVKAHNEGRFPKRSVFIYFDDGYKGVLTHAYPLLKKYNIPATLFVSTGFINGTNWPSWAEELDQKKSAIFLSWQDICSMRDMVTVGSHAVSHRKLSKLSVEEVEKELIESLRIIEDQTGDKPFMFSYPHSSYTKELQVMVSRKNIISVGNGRGYNYLNDYPTLKKIPIGSRDTIWMFIRKIKLYPIIYFLERIQHKWDKLIKA